MKFNSASRAPSSVLEGRVTEWNTDRGFGFLVCGAESWFLHMRSLAERDKIPARGDRVRFVPGVDPHGRPCAAEAVLVPRRFRKWAESGITQALLLVLPTLAILQVQPYSWSMITILICLSLLTFCFYLRDKQASVRGESRIPESTMRLLESVGGWPGALLAQRKLRHKTSKAAYQQSFWLVIICHQLLSFQLVIVSSGVCEASCAILGEASVGRLG